MNIVRITSGLGNQMFQYAFFKAIKHRNPNTKMDISEFRHRRHHQGYELEKLFSIETVYASRKECNQLADVSKDFISDIRRKLGFHLSTQGTLIDEGEIGVFFHPEFLSRHIDHHYFWGYWQTEKYFEDIAAELRTDFAFALPLDARNLKIAEAMEKENSISIHVRRGDYLKKRRVETIGSVCTLAYYHDAVTYIKERVGNPSFFIFSDDLEWVKEHLKIENANYVDNNIGADSYKDMQLMSLCKHNVIANSSFSWWGAWLNANPDKIVIAPDVWMKDEAIPDIVPEKWKRILTDVKV